MAVLFRSKFRVINLIDRRSRVIFKNKGRKERGVISHAHYCDEFKPKEILKENSPCRKAKRINPYLVYCNTFYNYKMRKYTVLKQVKITPEQNHYLEVLSKIYSINASQFIRQATIEKLQRDMPKIREKYRERFEEKLPF